MVLVCLCDHGGCPCPWWMSTTMHHVMSMLYGYVHAACSCQCTFCNAMSMSRPHVHIHVHAACPFVCVGGGVFVFLYMCACGHECVCVRAGHALFFYASRLRFRALGQSSSRWRFRALFWALNFALLRSRFHAPALLDFSRSFFALLNFSHFFRAPRFFALVHLRSLIFAHLISCSCVYIRPG